MLSRNFTYHHTLKYADKWLIQHISDKILTEPFKKYCTGLSWKALWCISTDVHCWFCVCVALKCLIWFHLQLRFPKHKQRIWLYTVTVTPLETSAIYVSKRVPTAYLNQNRTRHVDPSCLVFGVCINIVEFWQNNLAMADNLLPFFIHLHGCFLQFSVFFIH